MMTKKVSATVMVQAHKPEYRSRVELMFKAAMVCAATSPVDSPYRTGAVSLANACADALKIPRLVPPVRFCSLERIAYARDDFRRTLADAIVSGAVMIM